MTLLALLCHCSTFRYCRVAIVLTVPLFKLCFGRKLFDWLVCVLAVRICSSSGSRGVREGRGREGLHLLPRWLCRALLLFVGRLIRRAWERVDTFGRGREGVGKRREEEREESKEREGEIRRRGEGVGGKEEGKESGRE